MRTGDIDRPMQVIVTGGSRGIGREIVRTLADDGFDVHFTYRDSKDRSDALLAELRESWPEQSFEASRIDLVNQRDVEALTEHLSESDTLYGLIHNAGQSCDCLAAMVDRDRAEETMQVNFWSLTRMVAGAARPMMRARAGRIIGIGSMAALHAMPGNGIYAATKGAMLSYLRTVAVELARKGITSNYIAPGFVDTDMLASYAGRREQIESRIPSGRFAATTEIAALVGFLMSPAAQHINGSVLPIDGAMTAGVTLNV